LPLVDAFHQPEAATFSTAADDVSVISAPVAEAVQLAGKSITVFSPACAAANPGSASCA
jgi:hypothetical protein